MDVLKRQLVDAARIVYEKGLVEEGEGNLSLRVPGRKEMLITPTYNRYRDLEKKDLVRMRFNGEKIGGNRDASSEYRLHCRIYEKREGVNCVIHTHSTYASILSVLRKGIPVIFEEMLIFLGGSIEVSEYAQANTKGLAENVLEAMGKKNAVLMANHGVLACGRNMEDGIKIASLVEKMAHVYLEAIRKGEVYEIPEDRRNAFLEKFEKQFSTY